MEQISNEERAKLRSKTFEGIAKGYGYAVDFLVLCLTASALQNGGFGIPQLQYSTTVF